MDIIMASRYLGFSIIELILNARRDLKCSSSSIATKIHLRRALSTCLLIFIRTSPDGVTFPVVVTLVVEYSLMPTAMVSYIAGKTLRRCSRFKGPSDTVELEFRAGGTFFGFGNERRRRIGNRHKKPALKRQSSIRLGDLRIRGDTKHLIGSER